MVHTGMSLNERFTQIQTQQQPATRGRRSRSRSRSRKIVDSMVDPTVSAANARLLQELKRKHTVQTAMKLKRRSLRTAVTGGSATAARRVGGVKSLRLAPNGKPMRTNNVTRVATMRADLVGSGARRSGSSSRRTNSAIGLRQRLGLRRPTVGGAAERVAKRRGKRGGIAQQRRGRAADLQTPRQQHQQISGRSMSRGRAQSRSRSQSRGRDSGVRSQIRERSQSRRRDIGTRSQSRGRDIGTRSQTRGRRRQSATATRGAAQTRVSVKDRLGVRPGRVVASVNSNKRRPGRRASRLRGVASGRVDKRRNSTINAEAVQKEPAGAAGRNGRARGRSAIRAAAAASVIRRSRSRQRQNVTAAGAAVSKQQGLSGRAPGRRRRGRSVQRTVSASRSSNGNGNTVGSGTFTQQKARRGRKNYGRAAPGGRKVTGNNKRLNVKREDLDKELDHYMLTTKSEMDYLLK